jgi:hypothetical protein
MRSTYPTGIAKVLGLKTDGIIGNEKEVTTAAD